MTYELDPAWNRAEARDLAAADEMALRYHHFLGDVRLTVGDVDMSAIWGWIPLLDFAAGLVEVLKSLRSGGRGEVDFTESDARLVIRRDGDTLTIKPSYRPVEADVPYGDFLLAAMEARKVLCAELAARYPELAQNHGFTGLCSAT